MLFKDFKDFIVNNCIDDKVIYICKIIDNK